LKPKSELKRVLRGWDWEKDQDAGLNSDIVEPEENAQEYLDSIRAFTKLIGVNLSELKQQDQREEGAGC